MKKALITEAYMVWVNSLTHDQRKGLGLLYDGSFEFEPGNWGFDWNLHAPRDVLIDRVYTSIVTRIISVVAYTKNCSLMPVLTD